MSQHNHEICYYTIMKNFKHFQHNQYSELCEILDSPHNHENCFHKTKSEKLSPHCQQQLQKLKYRKYSIWSKIHLKKQCQVLQKACTALKILHLLNQGSSGKIKCFIQLFLLYLQAKNRYMYT